MAINKRVKRLLLSNQDISLQEVEQAVKEAVQKKRMNAEDIKTIIGVAKKVGLTDYDARQILQSAHINKQDIRAIMAGHNLSIRIPRTLLKQALKRDKALERNHAPTRTLNERYFTAKKAALQARSGIIEE